MDMVAAINPQKERVSAMVVRKVQEDRQRLKDLEEEMKV